MIRPHIECSLRSISVAGVGGVIIIVLVVPSVSVIAKTSINSLSIVLIDAVALRPVYSR